MLKDDAISCFGSQANFARELGRAPSTVCEYESVLPLEVALLTEKLTRGKLRVNFKLYSKGVPPRFRAPQ